MNISTIRVLAVLGLTVTLMPLGMMAQCPAHFNLPFGFTVGTKYMAPGTYSVEEVRPHVLQIRSDAGNASIFVIGNPDEPGLVAGKVTMSFQRYGNEYFLAKVADDNHGWRLPKSKSEKELIAGRVVPTTTTLGMLASIKK